MSTTFLEDCATPVASSVTLTKMVMKVFLEAAFNEANPSSSFVRENSIQPLSYARKILFYFTGINENI